MKLENKVAIITGGASGIGRAIAEAYSREGAKVVIADVNEDRMKETVDAITAAGGVAKSVKSDVLTREGNEAMFKFTLDEFGAFDILVCNAGIMDGFTTVGNLTDELWDRVMGINAKAPMMQMRYAVNYFLENGGGTIVATTSEAGLGGGRSGAAYTASKHALVGLVKNAAFAYAKQGIRVNAIAPGGAKTNIMESMPNIDQEGAQIFQAGSEFMPRIAEPSELATVALFLASDEASMVNGAIVPVDGGWNAY